MTTAIERRSQMDSHVTSKTHALIMQVKNLAFKKCIYWSQQKKECLLHRDGIFIPMPEHITHYCQKEFFHNCPHFFRLNLLIEDRRHFGRQTYRYPVVIKKCGNHLEESEFLPLKTDARTLDIGMGGMSILSRQELPLTGFVSFTLSINTKYEFVGKGQIRWVNRTAKKKYTQLGISFIKQNYEHTL